MKPIQRDLNRNSHGRIEVGLALLHERRKCLLGVLRSNLCALLIFGLHRRLDLFTKRLLHESLARLQRASRLPR